MFSMKSKLFQSNTHSSSSNMMQDVQPGGPCPLQRAILTTFYSAVDKDLRVETSCIIFELLLHVSKTTLLYT